jgi:hypothetical protein
MDRRRRLHLHGLLIRALLPPQQHLLQQLSRRLLLECGRLHRVHRLQKLLGRRTEQLQLA